MKIILGSGQAGRAVLKGLLRHNPTEEITLVSRTRKPKTNFPGNVHLITADVTNRHVMECMAREAEVIVSCADVPYPQWSGFYPAAADALAYALDKTSATLVFADNLYSYGNVAGAVMKETLPHNAQTKKGAVRAAVVNRLLFGGEAFSSRVAIVKASDFVGPTIHKGLLGIDFLNRLYQGKPVFLFGQPQLPHTFTYIYDFAEAVISVAKAPDAFGRVWHVPNAPAVSPRKWISLFERETGRRAVVKQLPKFLVRTAGWFHPFTRELYELAYQYEHPYLVDHNGYAKRFGNHATGPSVIVKETVEWYKQTAIPQKRPS